MYSETENVADGRYSFGNVDTRSEKEIADVSTSQSEILTVLLKRTDVLPVDRHLFENGHH